MSSNFSQGQIEISKQQEPPKLGIGLVTYNRLEHLKNCIECIRQFTTIPYYLVIADDGSSDGSVEWCHSQALAVITGDNRGVVWNKNRALFALVQYTSAESFVLLEDDCWPASETWAQEWHETTQLWHHINFAHPQTILARPGAILSGRGTAEKPYISGLVTGQCTGCSRHAVKQVGYLDTRFRGYGHGHVEWTRRFLRAGLGKAESLDEAKKSDRLVYLCITGGLEPHDAPTHRTTKELEYNSKIFKEIVNEPVYREPWKNDEEKNLLIREVNHLEGKTSQLECVASIKQAQKPKGDNQLNPQLINTVVRVTEVIKLVKKGTDLVLGYSIDRPQRNLELDMESLKISGWVVGTNTQAISVEFICNGEVICKAATNQHRPDVGKVYPQKSESENSGFSAIILLGQIPLEVGLLIQVILADQKRVPISLITFEKSSDSKVGNTLQPSIVSPQQASLSASSKENVINSPVPQFSPQQLRQVLLNEYKQTEALMNLHSLIELAYPLPPLRGWAASPDFAVLLYSLILERRVKVILELGSGASTLVMSYALKKMGSGKIVSLEHDQKHLERSRQLIKNHALEAYSEIKYAPLKETEVSGKTYNFYSCDDIESNDMFDLLVIDGPPSFVNPMARFPAVPVFYSNLIENSVLVLDDADRKDEKLAVKSWLSDYQDLRLAGTFQSEKGVTVLEKIK